MHWVVWWWGEIYEVLTVGRGAGQWPSESAGVAGEGLVRGSDRDDDVGE